MKRRNVLFFLLSCFILLADKSNAYELPVMLATVPDSSVSFWQKEKSRGPYYYLQYMTDTGHAKIELTIYGYDMDSIVLSTLQIDGMGLLEIIISYSMKGGGVDYCEEDVERWHCVRIFNPDTKTEIFTALDRNYDHHANHGCGPSPAFSYTCAWTYKLRIDAKGWIYISDPKTAHDCTAADKKAGVYIYVDGEYKWHDR